MKFLLRALALLTLLAPMARAEILSDVLREINFARTAPQQYARILAQQSPADRDAAEAVRFLERARPLEPLHSSTGLGQGAQLHVTQQGPSGGTGHGNPFARMEHFGEWSGRAGENICYGRRDARSIVLALIIDKGVAGKGHRKNIFSDSYSFAGVAYGPHATYGAMCVIDFATRYIERPATLASL